jgi:hypothetical protein
MVLPGHHFIAASQDGQILRGPEFRGTDSGFQLNIGTPEQPRWEDCGEPVGIPQNCQLNFAVLDGSGARPK